MIINPFVPHPFGVDLVRLINDNVEETVQEVKSKDEIITKYLNYIYHYFNEAIRIKDIAASLNISERYLRAHFKYVMEISPS